MAPASLFSELPQGQVQYGRRLLSTVVDDRAAAGYERPFASIPRSKSVRDGFRDISYAVLANAVNRCAAWLRDTVAVTKEDETVIYIGPLDLRYQILALAAAKSGHIVRA